jgi:hypothetical protein
MDVERHTTTLRDRSRLSNGGSGFEYDDDAEGRALVSWATTDTTATEEVIVLPYLGAVDRRTLLYGGGALGALLVLALLTGGRGGPVNDGAPVVNIS